MFVFVFVAAAAALSTICCAAKAAPGERTNGRQIQRDQATKAWQTLTIPVILSQCY